MKLLRARFENFRLLRDLELEFRTTTQRRLAVLRAANESGKTTILHGLRWALYDDTALPGQGKDFRLHPIDWDGENPVPIAVTVDFRVTKHRTSQGRRIDTHKHYQLVRSTTEDISTLRRAPSTVRLFEVTPTGSRLVPYPEAIVKEELPPELREVFFTDGDRALSFIEAEVTRSTKRQRVEQAIRSLLGLSILESAAGHVKNARAGANRRAKNINLTGDLRQVATRLEQLGADREHLEEELKSARVQFTAFDERLTEVGSKISLALAKGDRDKLDQELTETKGTISKLNAGGKKARNQHSQLFRSRSVANGLLARPLAGAYQRLEELRDRGKIPNTTIPVLEDRLATGTCICGETLDASVPAGAVRHEHITKLIEKSRHADAIQSIVTELYYRAVVPSDGDVHSADEWLTSYKSVAATRHQIDTDRDEAGQLLRALEAQLDALPNTDIRGLRQTQREYTDQRDRFLRLKAVTETKLEGVKRSYDRVERERDRLLRTEKRGARVRAQLTVTQDVARVLDAAERRIKSEELGKVSDKMNALFLKMIGADTDEVTDELARQQRSIIRRAEINEAFDILVHGPGGRPLNPDQDLNGASRRALTLAFILALTKVSEVEAPNVIDTPLGMTSGFVKRSILRTVASESSQLILFLTHDEIAGCEDILDEIASTVVTLTNPVHYPRMLVYPPTEVTVLKILPCNCDHRSTCRTCSRRSRSEASQGAKDGV